MLSTEITNSEEYLKAARIITGRDQSTKDIEECDKALRKVSNTQIGWVIVKELLPMQLQDSAVFFVVSKLLNNKVNHYLSELNEEDYLPLFSIILDSLCQKPMHNKPIRSNLSEALIIVYIRLFQKEEKFIDLMMSKFGTDPELRTILFEVLEMLPTIVFDE